MERTRVALAILGAICLSSTGDVAISQAMRNVPVWGLASPMLGLGILCHMGFFGIYLYALRREDLSFVLPLTALDYVLVTLLAAFAVGEAVSPRRWAGTLLVALGVGVTLKS